MLCVAPSTRWAPRYPRLADPETHAGLSAIHGAVCEEEVMLKCTSGMNEVDAYVEHGVHQYVPVVPTLVVRCALWGDPCGRIRRKR